MIRHVYIVVKIRLTNNKRPVTDWNVAKLNSVEALYLAIHHASYQSFWSSFTCNPVGSVTLCKAIREIIISIFLVNA